MRVGSGAQGSGSSCWRTKRQVQQFSHCQQLLALIYEQNVSPTSRTGVPSSSPSLQLPEDSDGAFRLSTSSVREELTMDTAVILPYRSRTA